MPGSSPCSREMAEQVRAVCERLVQAVTVIMEPNSAQEHRMEALRFCEEFKETCAVCVPCGLQLAEKSQPPIIRHFGLQVLEHVVKFRWNNMEGDEKLLLKDSVMRLMAAGVRPILEEEGHIKDVLARIVVEMIKREWPQHWPNMLTELEGLIKKGEVQTELVMFILLRLAEDVVTFQNLPGQRRRDIQTTMTQNMEQLFTFMLSILGDAVHQYQQLKSDSSQKDKYQGLCRVALAALNTLAGYIDWVSIIHITAQDCKLLQMLCLLLEEDELQVEAAECLLIAVSRKGKLEDRLPLLVLFGDNPMQCIMAAAQKAHSEGLQEKRYVFLKRLCQVLCALGSQLCALTLSPDFKVKIPVTFGKYLSSLREFTVHPSQFLRSSTLMTWGSIFRHEVLSKDAAVKAMVPEFLRISMSNVVKVGFPSRNDSPSCEYSRLDCDNDEDFNTFFNYFKALIGDVMRSACRLDPMTGFCLAEEWLQFQLSAPSESGLNSSRSGDGPCSLLSPSFIQWDAMTFFCECVILTTLRSLPKQELPVTRGVELLQQVLSYETEDPLILSCVLTVLSVLLPFMRYVNGFMPAILNKLFSAVAFELCNQLISAFSPFVWMDTPACQKAAAQLCWPLLKQMVSSSLPSEAALCFFTNVLRGLQIHGQHEACNGALVNLAYQIYIALRPQVTELRVVMEQIPEIQRDALQQFDSRLLFTAQKQGEKRRKEQFRRLISGCIGKPLGEQFRKEVHIRNLPSLFQKKPRPVLSEDAILGSCAESLPALFQP
ncbi:exportin-5 [Hyla sarda]|uniref:exportin-5 n=1 Tax=Hyla sarda TaxID=327740 RepID=UPI0024C409B4|nr:exportin-5 [Hyla sarda]